MQDPPLRYSFHIPQPIDSLFLISNRSQAPEEVREGDERGGGNQEKNVDG